MKHLGLMVFIGTVALAGCADGREDSDSARSDSLQQLMSRDATGRMVALARPATKVASLAPSLTEILFAIGAGSVVVGRTQYCNYPPEALAVPVVSDLSTPNYERLLKLRPDLALMTFAGNSSAAYNKLLELGIQPYAIAAETIEGTLGAIDTVGRLVGRQSESRRLVASIRASIDSVRALVPNEPAVTVFIVLDRAPLMTVSGGFINEALEAAGARNIAAGDVVAYPRFSREEVLRQDPDVIIVPGDSAVPVASLLASFPEWSRLRAVTSGRVRTLPPDVLFRPGPRLGQSIALIHAALAR